MFLGQHRKLFTMVLPRKIEQISYDREAPGSRWQGRVFPEGTDSEDTKKEEKQTGRYSSVELDQHVGKSCARAKFLSGYKSKLTKALESENGRREVSCACVRRLLIASPYGRLLGASD